MGSIVTRSTVETWRTGRQQTGVGLVAGVAVVHSRYDFLLVFYSDLRTRRNRCGASADRDHRQNAGNSRVAECRSEKETKIL